MQVVPKESLRRSWPLSGTVAPFCLMCSFLRVVGFPFMSQQTSPSPDWSPGRVSSVRGQASERAGAAAELALAAAGEAPEAAAAQRPEAHAGHNLPVH